MNPVDITIVDFWDTWAYISIIIAIIPLVIFAIIDITRTKRRHQRDKAAGNRSSDDPVGRLIYYMIMVFISVTAFVALVGLPYGSREHKAESETLERVEQEANVTIMNKKDILYSNLRSENSSTPISFKHEGNIYEGFLIAENDALVILVPNQPEEERKLVLFGSNTGE